METLALILKKSNDILLDSSIQSLIKQDQQVASAVVGEIIKSNVPIPALSSSIIFLQAIAKGESYGNLIQAQRDYFGAHGYQRVDDPLRNKVHTNWKE